MNRFLPLIMLFLAAIVAVVLLVPTSTSEDGGDEGVGGGAGGPAAGVLEGDAAGDAAGDTPEAGRYDESGSREDLSSEGASAVGQGGTVEVRYVDASGAPIAGLEVRAMSGTQSGFMLPFQRDQEEEGGESVQTDANGRALVPVNPGETATILARGDYWARDFCTLQPLRAGESLDLGERTLTEASRMSGVVLGADDKPLAEASVQLRVDDGAGFGLPTHGTRTDEKGQYVLGGVAAGNYRATVSGPGHAEQQIGGLPVAGSGDHEEDFRLERGRRAHGLVMDQDRNPVAGAELWVQSSGNFFIARSGADGRPMGVPGAISGRDGRFTLDGLPDGNARIVAWAEGYATASERFAGEDGEMLIELKGHARYSGTLLSPAGTPVADCELRLEPQSREDWRFWMRSARTRTDAEGHFAFEDVQPGLYEVDASTQDAAVSDLTIDLTVAQVDQELRMQAVPVMVVAVTDPNGDPLAGARVRLSGVNGRGPGGVTGFSVDVDFGDVGGAFGPGRALDKTTSEDGLACFPELSEGVYELSVRADGMATVQREVVRGRGAQREEVPLRPGADLRVRVLDGAELPVADVDVVLHDLQTDKERVKRSDLTGRAWWDGLPAGAYVVEARAGGGGGAFGNFRFMLEDETEKEEPEPEGERVELKEGAQADLVLTLEDLALPEVRVTRDGVPVAGAEVALQEPGEGSSGMSIPGLHMVGGAGQRTAADGRVKLPPVEPGKWDLVVRTSSSAAEHRETVELRAGSRLLEVQIGGATVTGQVLGDAGPLAGARVTLQPYPEGEEKSSAVSTETVIFALSGPRGEVVQMGGSTQGAVASVRTDAEGRFRLEDVPQGEWIVQVKAQGYRDFASASFRSNGDGEQQIDSCRLEQGGHIEGKAPEPPDTSANGLPNMRGSFVRLEDADGNRVQSTMARRGEYSFRDLDPGTYHVVQGDYRSPALEVKAGQTVEHDLP